MVLGRGYSLRKSTRREKLGGALSTTIDDAYGSIHGHGIRVADMPCTI